MQHSGPTGAGCPNASCRRMSDLARYVGPAAADQPPGIDVKAKVVQLWLCCAGQTLQSLTAVCRPCWRHWSLQKPTNIFPLSTARGGQLLLSHPLSLGKKRGLVFQLYKKLGRPGVMRRAICIAGPLLVAAALLVSASAQNPVSSTSNVDLDEAIRPLGL